MKRKLMRLLARLPSRLPQGRADFNAWAKSIIYMAEAPDNDSTRFAVAAMIMHGSGTSGYKSKWFFVRQLIKASANEVAHAVLTELKAKQQESLKSEQKDAALKVVSGQKENI